MKGKLTQKEATISIGETSYKAQTGVDYRVFEPLFNHMCKAVGWKDTNK
jgi:hypothetical protein